MPAPACGRSRTWEEACATAGRSRLRLLNWLLLTEGRHLYSIAEFTPSRPVWSIREPASTGAKR